MSMTMQELRETITPLSEDEIRSRAIANRKAIASVPVDRSGWDMVRYAAEWAERVASELQTVSPTKFSQQHHDEQAAIVAKHATPDQRVIPTEVDARGSDPLAGGPHGTV